MIIEGWERGRNRFVKEAPQSQGDAALMLPTCILHWIYCLFLLWPSFSTGVLWSGDGHHSKEMFQRDVLCYSRATGEGQDQFYIDIMFLQKMFWSVLGFDCFIEVRCINSLCACCQSPEKTTFFIPSVWKKQTNTKCVGRQCTCSQSHYLVHILKNMYITQPCSSLRTSG